MVELVKEFGGEAIRLKSLAQDHNSSILQNLGLLKDQGGISIQVLRALSWNSNFFEILSSPVAEVGRRCLSRNGLVIGCGSILTLSVLILFWIPSLNSFCFLILYFLNMLHFIGDTE
ncbi:hypothetical protein ACHQM5_016864 [Ranunculus cassubicifolius]